MKLIQRLSISLRINCKQSSIRKTKTEVITSTNNEKGKRGRENASI